MNLILSDSSFNEPQMLRARYVLYPGWWDTHPVFHSTSCDPRVSSCVHTQPFGRWATDWRWFLPRRSSVLPRLPPCRLIATRLQWWGYRLLIAVKPLRASCVLSPAASWQHSNKLLAMQLPCTQRGSPSLWTWSSQPSCHSGQPNMNLC